MQINNNGKFTTRNEMRPAIVSDEHLTYLDDLRESGVTNMWGAGLYLEQDFGVSKEDATEIFLYWMKTFPRKTENE